MVTSRQGPSANSTAAAAAARPKKRGMGGFGLKFLLFMLTIGVIGLGGIGLFAPSRLAIFQEQTLALLHGGIVSKNDETYVDGCVRMPEVDGPRAVRRTLRTVIFGDGTTLQIIFSDVPTATNACQ
ncbi:MAG: hypothetical protein EI684_08920 [Candidatus Viridilinea halotolerans]|uniref:Uncharacterized protein n=1 Tax=Candidatus Viridilinea halotolerans TaxID=2491704 RepID=A0A426U1N5_9CHLR|nr:MAG: hypothetical protein EI684_08920 [Candidatus Viridilinea halotolerans]